MKTHLYTGFILLFLAILNVQAEEQRKSFLTDSKPFSRESLEQPVKGFSLTDPNRFSMQQSYSTTMTYSGGGSLSYGLYLNTLSYQLAGPLSLSMDMGFYSPFQGTGMYSQYGSTVDGMGQFVLPRVGLDYSPTKNTHFSLQFYNLAHTSPGMLSYPNRFPN